MSSAHNSGSGCFSGIVRLLLCKGSHQTHPSDQRVEPIITECFNHVKKDRKIGIAANVEAPVSISPGVVARLMGLDSLPDTNWVPQGRSTPESVTRSRSVNFMDYLLQLDLAQAQHRRVRTSVSFREVPALLNQENHDIYVHCLDKHDKKLKKMGSKQRKSEGIGPGDQMKQKNYEDQNKNQEESLIAREGAEKMEKNRQNNNMKVSTSKSEPKRVSSNRQISRFGSCKGVQFSSGLVMPHKKDVSRKSRENPKARSPVKKPINQKEVLVESKFMKRIKNRQVNKDSQSDCSSEDSSAISILGLNDFLAHDAIPLPGDTWAMDLKYSKRISSPNPPKSTDNKPINGEVEPAGIKKNDFKSCNNRDREHYIEVQRKLCRLTEEDVQTKTSFDFECLEEMFTEFGQHILDLLLCQVVEELAESHMEKF